MKSDEKNIRFPELIDENKGLILKICLFYTKTEADREDLFQDIVLQAWKSFPGFRQESKFSTWLYKVALNTALSLRRKQKRLFDEPYPEIPVPDFHQNENDPTEKMYAAIQELNEIEKSIVLLYLDAYSYEEMENILGIPNGNLRVKMTRIKQKLKTIIK